MSMKKVSMRLGGMFEINCPVVFHLIALDPMTHPMVRRKPATTIKRCEQMAPIATDTRWVNEDRLRFSLGGIDSLDLEKSTISPLSRARTWSSVYDFTFPWISAG